MKLQINSKNSYKIGTHEVVGLEDAMQNIMSPIAEILRDKMYWNETLEFKAVEYKSRDGFIANQLNCGGIAIFEVIPEYEQYKFNFLEFGEATHDASLSDEENDSVRESELGDGHLDAALRIWFKFEGLSDGLMHFAIFVQGGNGDAPYFRRLDDIYEGEFSCKTLTDIQRASAKHVKAIMKILA
jgi:hypothetical protein